MDEKIIKQLENKDFVLKLLSFENYDDAKNLFKQSGINISDEDLNELGEILFELIKSVNDMTQSDLQKIAGGVKLFNEIPFTGLFKKAGEHYRIDKGGTPSTPTTGWKILGTYKPGKPGIPGTPGTPLGNFLYNNSNELALSSLIVAGAVFALGASYVFEKGQQWYMNREK